MNFSDSLGLPYPPYLRMLARNSVLVWLLVRLMYVAVLMVGVFVFGLLPPAAGISAVLHPTWITRLALVMITALFVWLDRKRSHEQLLHANLGTSELWFWAVSLLTALGLDLATQALLSPL